MSIKYTKVDTIEDQLIYVIPALRNRTILTVTIGNDILTEDQYTLDGETFTIIETDIKVTSKSKNLIISHQWEKRN
jgi:hypothetical protein